MRLWKICTYIDNIAVPCAYADHRDYDAHWKSENEKAQKIWDADNA